MVPRIYTVSDQLTLRVCKTEKFKAGMLSLSVTLPIRKETAYLTSLLLAVLRRGTDKYPTLADINRRLDYLYGTELSIRNFYRGDAQVIGFSAELLDDSYLPMCEESILDGALDVMCQIFFHPCLDENGWLLEKYVEREKQLQCDQIRARKNHPRAYAAERLRELLYENEPCGVLMYGSEEQVMAVTAKQLTAHWRALITDMRPDCFYVGPSCVRTVKQALLRSIGKELTAKKTEKEICVPTVIRTAKAVRRVDEELSVSQGHLLMGLRCGANVRDTDFYAVAVYNEMLGVSPISKLFVNVREKESLCYHCSSTYNIYKGTIMISCGLENSNRDRAERAILDQIEALKNGDFTDAELCAAKKSLKNSYHLLEDSPTATESYYFGRSLVGMDDSLAHCLAQFASVSREDVLRVAKQTCVDVIYYLKGTLEKGEEEIGDDELD